MLTLSISGLTTSNFTLTHGPNIPGSYVILLFTALDFHHQSHPQMGVFGFFSFSSVSSFFLKLFLHWSPVAYWAPTNLGVHLSVSYLFAFSYCSWGSQGNNTEVLCHSLLQRATFCQNSLPWTVRLGWPYTVWLSFLELIQGCGPCDQIVQFSVIVVFSLSALWWRRIRGLWKLPDGRDWLRGKVGLALMAGICSINL